MAADRVGKITKWISAVSGSKVTENRSTFRDTL